MVHGQKVECGMLNPRRPQWSPCWHHLTTSIVKMVTEEVDGDAVGNTATYKYKLCMCLFTFILSQSNVGVNALCSCNLAKKEV